MNARKNWTAAITIAAVATLGLAGCSGGGGSGGDDDTLDVWHNSTTGPGKEYWEEVAAAFEEETGVSVNITSVQNEDLDGKLQTAANSGDMPDVFLARRQGPHGPHHRRHAHRDRRRRVQRLHDRRIRLRRADLGAPGGDLLQPGSVR